jgi:hypothetical protein
MCRAPVGFADIFLGYAIPSFFSVSLYIFNIKLGMGRAIVHNRFFTHYGFNSVP